MHLRRLLIVALLRARPVVVLAARDVLDFIDPLIGTIQGGHVFPGASLPYSMAKAVADVDDEMQGGFASNDASITGFSHMHDSGTGGGASLGNFPLFPQIGCPGDDIRKCPFPKAQRAIKRMQGSVLARPGYFAVSLANLIRAEMTVANHTALYRFTFPTPGAETGQSFADKNPLAPTPPPYSPMILADLTDLSNSLSQGSISVDPASGRIMGNGTFSPSFGVGTYTLHFCADFAGARIRDTGIFNYDGPTNRSHNLQTHFGGEPSGAWVWFERPRSNQILARVGVSFMSAYQACRNAETEIQDFDLEGTRAVAENAWRQKLSVVSVDPTGVSVPLQRAFWSGFYRSLISPQDYTGENPLWQSNEPYFDSYYCIWDSHRTTHPFLTLVDPHAQALMVRSLIDVYRHLGKLPDCRMSLCKGLTQGGSNADNLLADSFLKGLRDGIDWETGYEAVVSDAEVQPYDWTVEGRGGLRSWKSLGYIPVDDDDYEGKGLNTRSVSRTIEYAYNDFCIAEMARDMGRRQDAEKYLKRSTNWINVFDSTSRSVLNLPGSPDSPSEAGLVDSGFQGFVQPRYTNGTFGFQDPALCSPLLDFTACYLNPSGHETYEGGAWLYTFYVPHDQATLIKTLGGPDTYVRRLQYFHDTPGLFYLGDEQSYLLVFLFHYAGRPGLSSQYTHRYIPSAFNDTLNGIPGNDDSGAMGSFQAMAMMGFFPVGGQDVYLIIPPFYREISITNPLSGRIATIRNHGFDSAYRNIYIQSAKLNGRPYTRSWLTHAFFVEGGLLELFLGPEESPYWGKNKADLPPSLSTGF
ncbi:hypothetical protein HIM_07685 [Hirsutella minnesotensis 3608]|uniref:Glycosyl hydrolase family 92 domain-containing protein n=1 Tax=Hirsutella minnesotensis 3608 TaxID=1043627 RepID=A0A0F7ZYR3_9HYPO|nr:hypothetical protein HIM_07685 [Hirsutella minnesotensis 3608]